MLVCGGAELPLDHHPSGESLDELPDSSCVVEKLCLLLIFEIPASGWFDFRQNPVFNFLIL
jgi:hypothetical protein